jgi:hypothetical protein
MKGFKKIVLLTVGALAVLAVESQAAIITPKPFSFYGSTTSGAFAHSPGFYMYFVQWRKSSVAWTPQNIGWAKYYGSTHGVGTCPPWTANNSTGPSEPGNPGGGGPGYPGGPIVPEPTSLALVFGGSALLLGRRRAAK